MTRRNSGGKRPKSFSISPSNAEFLESEHDDNQSALVDELIEQYRSGPKRADIAGKQARLEQKKERREQLREQLDNLNEEIERLEETIEELKHGEPDELGDVFDKLELVEESVADNPRQRFDETNEAVRNHAQKVGMNPSALLEQYHEHRKNGENPHTETAEARTG